MSPIGKRGADKREVDTHTGIAERVRRTPAEHECSERAAAGEDRVDDALAIRSPRPRRSPSTKADSEPGSWSGLLVVY